MVEATDAKSRFCGMAYDSVQDSLVAILAPTTFPLSWCCRPFVCVIILLSGVSCLVRSEWLSQNFSLQRFFVKVRCGVLSVD